LEAKLGWRWKERRQKDPIAARAVGEDFMKVLSE
jgi:hypothetical protein